MDNQEKPPVSSLPMKIEMFKDYCDGRSFSYISQKYGVVKSYLYHISIQEEWKKGKKALIDKAKDAYAQEISDVASRTIHILNNEIEKIMEKVDNNEELSNSDRIFLVNVFDKFSKEVRLDDGKPTQNVQNTGVVEHRIKLPPGAKRFGVFPPGPNTTLVEEPIDVTPTKEDGKDEV